jgi:ubiquitin carboxyl-terminal hydrolase 36/42
MFSTQSSADEPLHYHPAKDLDTFNSLLPPPIEFIEGSSSGMLAVAEGKYEPINASPKVSNAEVRAQPSGDRVFDLINA